MFPCEAQGALVGLEGRRAREARWRQEGEVAIEQPADFFRRRWEISGLAASRIVAKSQAVAAIKYRFSCRATSPRGGPPQPAAGQPGVSAARCPRPMTKTTGTQCDPPTAADLGSINAIRPAPGAAVRRLIPAPQDDLREMEGDGGLAVQITLWGQL